MDKFDCAVKNAQQEYKPSDNFVETVMQQINAQNPKHRRSFKLWSVMLAGGLAAVVIIFLVAPFGYNKLTNNTASNSPGQSSQAASSSSLPAGISNAGLTGDLNSINSSMSQENADQNAANTTLNDQSQEIAIPTN